MLAKVDAEGQWGRALPAGSARGIASHDEDTSCTACLVEVDVGLPINPRGLQDRMPGGLTDAIATVFRAGLHVQDGLPLERDVPQCSYCPPGQIMAVERGSGWPGVITTG